MKRIVFCISLFAAGIAPGLVSNEFAKAQQAGPGPAVNVTHYGVSFDYAHVNVPIAGVAAGQDVVFVGEPLDGKVIALSRLTGKKVGELPPPPNGFALPFIMHIVGDNNVAILDAGGVPQPNPFVPSNPTIYEYAWGFDRNHAFSAALTRTISFASVVVGFSEDFTRLQDGRYLLSDAVLGSIWVVERDGTVVPRIVPRSFDLPDLIPQLAAICPPMPTVTVNGLPFLFTGSALPGVSPMAVRHGTVYYFSPCARGIYAFPLSILSDHRQPYQRAADIRLVAATAADVAVEELFDFAFNPYNPHDRYLYAADALQLRVIRIDVSTGARQVVANDPKLFDFPSALSFAPTFGPVSELFVVSNQQERLTVTNDAAPADAPNLPFIAAKILALP